MGVSKMVNRQNGKMLTNLELISPMTGKFYRGIPSLFACSPEYMSKTVKSTIPAESAVFLLASWGI
jgi:hypothetical protein